MNQVWVVNVIEWDDFELYSSKEKAIAAYEHNYELTWDGDRAKGYHKFTGEKETTEVVIYPKEVL